MSHRVTLATASEIGAWLALAAEVGDLFGADMANDPRFRASVESKIHTGGALCVRLDGSLAGGMLFGAGTIKWLAVFGRFRRCGVGRALVSFAQASGGDVRVTTFGVGHPHPDAPIAQKLYRDMGFEVEHTDVPRGPDGSPREGLLWIARPRITAG